MCGICGYTGPEIPALIGRMNDAIFHRGPDSGGSFNEAEVHLGIRRLRILDVEGGDMPIFNEDRTIALVYNGEIYNFQPLRQELEERGHRFATRGDTEVIVHLYEEEGVAGFAKLNGMFALALYDTRRERLVLARDQVGIKPLVYFWNGKTLVFGSEAKSVVVHPEVSPALDPAALHHLLNIRFVPSPRTLFRGIAQLPPGHVAVLEDGRLEISPYWRWEFGARADLDIEEAAAGFLEALERSVERQLISEVPLGVYLSGGLDSSSVVMAARAARGEGELSTFSLGFDEPTDELDDAAIVARHFATRHRDTTLTMRALELYPRIVHHAEMPKVNAAQGYYLARFARQHVTVALSGLGGDELFLGYALYRYLWPGRFSIDSPLGHLLRPLRGLFDATAVAFDGLAGLRGESARRMIELLASARDPLRYYATLRNGWDLGGAITPRLYEPSFRATIGETTRDALAPYFDRPDLPFIEQVQWAEFRSKMVDDFLWNEDRMSMANSLEVRVPLLDLEMVRFAFSLPLAVKRREGQLKPVMKRALAPRLPPEILRKKKWGFTFDSYEQYQKDLRELCRRELDRDFVARQGIFRYDFLQRVFDARPSPLLRWHYFMLWQILGLKFWSEIFIEGRQPAEIEERLARA